MPILQFEPFSSAVDATFWKALSDQKINVLKLSFDQLPISAHYPIAGKSAATMCLTSAGFDGIELHGSQFLANGMLRNTNTIEEFRELDKSMFLASTGERVALH